MTLKEQIMKLQTYKMYEGEDTVYVERDDVLKALEQQLKTGKWLDASEGLIPYACSKCGAVEFKISKYCPKCGTKMEEP